ncbi:MAG: hypothetical protein WB699_06815 [Bacteroidota bacterium]
MRNLRTFLPAMAVAGLFVSCKTSTTGTDSDAPYFPSFSSVTVNHQTIDLALIPTRAVDSARATLRIAYGHTSHGSQLVTGMTALAAVKGEAFRFNNSGSGGALTLHDTPFSGASDLGNPDRVSWAAATRSYLTANSDVNVVIWSWCGEVSNASEADIETYLSLMNGLEHDYPAVRFVYMTGHLDGTGLDGTLHKRNDQIRAYCAANNKSLFDFEDIESYDPDGKYFGDKLPNDNCDYDSNGDGSLDGNWAIEWQQSHPGQWYACDAAHSQPLNANMKAYAAWWLWVRLAGWPGAGDEPF